MSKLVVLAGVGLLFAGMTSASVASDEALRCAEVRAEINRLGGVLANHVRRYERWASPVAETSDFVRQNRMIWLNGAIAGARTITEQEMPAWLSRAEEFRCLDAQRIEQVKREASRMFEPMMASGQGRSLTVQESGITRVRVQ